MRDVGRMLALALGLVVLYAITWALADYWRAVVVLAGVGGVVWLLLLVELVNLYERWREVR